MPQLPIVSNSLLEKEKNEVPNLGKLKFVLGYDFQKQEV